MNKHETAKRNIPEQNNATVHNLRESIVPMAANSLRGTWSSAIDHLKIIFEIYFLNMKKQKVRMTYAWKKHTNKSYTLKVSKSETDGFELP